MGMVGTGKVYSFRIERAAKELECSLDKIKRWIKKKNHRMKQTRTGDTNEVIPEAKRVKLTPWQAYMKDFGKSDEGKAITKTRGTKEFSQAASYAYKALAPSEKEKLRGKCCDHMQPLTAKIIEKNGHKIFKNIDIQIQQLQDLGYSAFSFGFFQEDVHFVRTPNSQACSDPKVVQYLMALITASMYSFITDWWEKWECLTGKAFHFAKHYFRLRVFRIIYKGGEGIKLRVFVS